MTGQRLPDETDGVQMRGASLMGSAIDRGAENPCRVFDDRTLARGLSRNSRFIPVV